jgi:DegV family protein with EDD domain
MIAAKELHGQGTFHVFDSQAGSAAQGYMALAAARLAQQGAGIDAILSRLETMRREMSVIFTIDSLEYARKGGRVSNVKSVMASLLNIKPILELRGGLIEEAGRVRTRKKAMTHIVDYVRERVGDKKIDLAVIHANAFSDAEVLCEQAKAALNTSEVIIVDMAISVAINLGPGALGLVAMPSAA